MDEVGRGCLAGPLVAAATILNTKLPSHASKILRSKLKDSKQLNSKQRNKLYKKIVKYAEVTEVEIISARQINNRGMGWANREVFKKLIKRISADKYIIDGNLKIRNAVSMVKADTKIPEVMAASIVAKVVRDQHMIRLHEEHVMYGWKSNKGYGTRYHIQAIKEYGMSRYHRSVFVTTALRNGSRCDNESQVGIY